MNKLFLLLFLMPFGLFAQSYTKTVDVPGKDAVMLYNKAKGWFAESFNTPGSVPPTEDAAQRKLTCRESVTSMIYWNEVAVSFKTSFLLILSFKDGQYKYEFDNIMVDRGQKIALSTFKNGTTREGTIEMYKAAGQKTPSNKTIESNIEYSVKIVNKVDAELNRLIDSLADKMMN